eukprot:scaffold155979_cov23-Tisochrysis_lutea.AAC.1
MTRTTASVQRLQGLQSTCLVAIECSSPPARETDRPRAGISQGKACSPFNPHGCLWLVVHLPAREADRPRV